MKLPNYIYNNGGWCKWYYNPFTWVLLLFLFVAPLTAFADTSCTTGIGSQFFFTTSEFYTNQVNACDSYLDSLAAFPGDTITIAGSNLNDGTYTIANTWSASTHDYFVNETLISDSFDGHTITITHITGGGGGGGSGTTTLPFPGYEASTTFQVVDNPNQDMFNVFLLFVMGFFGGYWLFAKRR